jgi:hypothetical protein
MMSESPNLRDVQKRTIQLMNFEDGLWDLLLGTIFMTLAAYPVTRVLLGPVWNLVLVIGLILLLAAGQLIIRQRFATPRLGYAKPKRTPALRLILAITVLMVVLTFGLAILTMIGPGLPPISLSSTGTQWWQSYLVEIIVLLVMVGIFSGMGYLFGVPRLYFYGWLLGGTNVASVIMNQGASNGFDLPLAIAAGIIILIGAGLLIRFIRKYPVWTSEA